jgi:uncharacterized membrane protein
VDYGDSIEAIGKAVDVAGVAAMIAGGGIASAWYLRNAWRLASLTAGYRPYRRNLGRAILLGLELLVAGDIIRTVAVSPTFTSLGVLAIIVVIRTFLSFALELELTGRWPWENKEPETATPIE